MHEFLGSFVRADTQFGRSQECQDLSAIIADRS